MLFLFNSGSLPKRSIQTVSVERMSWPFNTVIRGSDENQLLKETSLSCQFSTSVMSSITDQAQIFLDTFFLPYLALQYGSMN